MEAKPILVIRNKNIFTEHERTRLNNKLSDYHVIILLKDVEDIEFEVYNAKDAKDIDIETLKSMLDIK